MLELGHSGELAGDSLLWGVVGEVDTLRNIVLENPDGRIHQTLFLARDVLKWVDGLLDTVGLWKQCISP